jgi:hypothetical protein
MESAAMCVHGLVFSLCWWWCQWLQEAGDACGLVYSGWFLGSRCLEKFAVTAV